MSELKQTLNGIGKLLPMIMATVAIALIGWTMREVLEMRDTLARLQVTSTLTTNDRYRAADAREDLEDRDRVIQDHEDRIRNLERARLK